MKGGQGAAGASTEDDEEGARSGASFHVEQYGQSGLKVQASMTLEEGREAGDAGGVNAKEDTGNREFKHISRHKRLSHNILEPGTPQGGGRTRVTMYGGGYQDVRSRLSQHPWQHCQPCISILEPGTVERSREISRTSHGDKISRHVTECGKSRIGFTALEYSHR